MPLGGRPWDEWIAQYGRSHEHPVNRLCHTIGIPLIVISLLVGLVALAVPGLWWIAAALFVSGWILQFVGHAFEGKPPEFAAPRLALSLRRPAMVGRTKDARTGVINLRGTHPPFASAVSLFFFVEDVQ